MLPGDVLLALGAARLEAAAIHPKGCRELLTAGAGMVHNAKTVRQELAVHLATSAAVILWNGRTLIAVWAGQEKPTDSKIGTFNYPKD